MTIKNVNKKVRIGSLSATALAVAFGAALLIPTASAAGPQDSVVTDVMPAPCSATSSYTADIEGIFPAAVTQIFVNGIEFPSTQWVQSMFKIAITIPASSQKSFTVDLYNGLTPVIGKQTFFCAGTVVVPTETGGTLPNTSTNNYNYLAAGVVLSVIGASGVLLRRRAVN